MPELEIRQVDVHDDRQLRGWHDAYLLAERHERPFATPWMFEELRANVQAPPVADERPLVAGLVDGEVVTVAGAVVPLRDNLERAEVHVHTHPDHRRRGHASALLTHLERLLAERGRHTFETMAAFRYDAGPTGEGEPAPDFFRANGYRLGLTNLQRRLDLPLDEGLLARLEREAAAYGDGYRLRSWVDRCPDDLAASYARLVGRLMAEAPAGDLHREAEVYDAERVRADEAKMAAAGRTGYVTVALDPADEVVAYTQLAASSHDPGVVFQWGTLVDQRHRGRRLGLAVKVANHRLLQARDPGARRVLTWNADVNTHMVAVNERLGFRPVARVAEFEKQH